MLPFTSAKAATTVLTPSVAQLMLAALSAAERTEPFAPGTFH
jgi:hypothetical protein